MGHLMPVYSPLPVTFERGEGVWLYDSEGNRYLDAIAGIAVNTLGHAHPKLTRALQEQAGKLLHVSNIFHIKEQQRLAHALCQRSRMQRVFFSNSGAEANEAAIKIARLYGHQKQIMHPSIIVMENAFHGRTMATLTASASRKVQAGFEPLLPGFVRAPFNDLDVLRSIAQHDPNVVAVLLEPIQGESGVRVPSQDYLQQVRQLCREKAWLFMVDEVQTGVGRTGSWYKTVGDDTLPDVLTSAKGLGGGVPIGATLVQNLASDCMQAGNHGSTFGGNPLSCRAALAVLETIEEEALLNNATQQGQTIIQGLRKRLEHNPVVKAIRGEGLMIGIEIDRECRTPMMMKGLAHQILFNVAGGQVVRLLPPLILQHEHAEMIIEKVSLCIDEFASEVAST